MLYKFLRFLILVVIIPIIVLLLIAGLVFVSNKIWPGIIPSSQDASRLIIGEEKVDEKPDDVMARLDTMEAKIDSILQLLKQKPFYAKGNHIKPPGKAEASDDFSKGAGKVRKAKPKADEEDIDSEEDEDAPSSDSSDRKKRLILIDK